MFREVPSVTRRLLGCDRHLVLLEMASEKVRRARLGAPQKEQIGRTRTRHASLETHVYTVVSEETTKLLQVRDYTRVYNAE